MKIRLLWPVLLFALVACASLKKHEATPLFNGRDLHGWVPMHAGQWTVEDRVLVGRNGANWSTNPEKSGSWLRTAKEYADFVLELDYAINQGGNSGVFIRSALEKNPAFTGYEMQILADAGSNPSKGSSGSLYDVVAPAKNMSQPAGEWNHAKISAHGQHIQIWLNAEQIIDYTQASRSPKGYIGFQNHDTRSVVKFRNIQITEL